MPTRYVLNMSGLQTLPPRINNDMIINVSGATAPGDRGGGDRDRGANGDAGGNGPPSIRRRFQRAFKADSTNTVQVDHSTRGLLVDGEAWAGFGWCVAQGPARKRRRFGGRCLPTRLLLSVASAPIGCPKRRRF